MSHVDAQQAERLNRWAEKVLDDMDRLVARDGQYRMASPGKPAWAERRTSSTFWSYHGLTAKISMQIVRTEEDSKGFEKVFSFLWDLLLEGRIQPGDKLIPERELALELGVSRPVVREALRALSMIGAVEIRERVGTIVRRPDVSTLGEFFAFALAQEKDVVEDVMEARVAIECQSIRLACRRATLADLERLRAAIDRIESTVDQVELGSQADFEFHAALVQAGGSKTLINLHGTVAALLIHSHRNRRETVQMHPDIKARVIADHRRIFQAVVDRDEEAADRVLREHFSIGDEYRHKAATEWRSS
ncbi:FadR/GntR family transcriptional regulator [Caballeronia concitans]|nr:FadR/GntR family transcriptional regulator [Caballeronia concitans]